MLIWRVAGALPDAVVVVPAPIASTPFVEQAVERSGGRHPASLGEGSAGDDDAHLHTDLAPEKRTSRDAVTKSASCHERK